MALLAVPCAAVVTAPGAAALGLASVFAALLPLWKGIGAGLATGGADGSGCGGGFRELVRTELAMRRFRPAASPWLLIACPTTVPAKTHPRHQRYCIGTDWARRRASRDGNEDATALGAQPTRKDHAISAFDLPPLELRHWAPT